VLLLPTPKQKSHLSVCGAETEARSARTSTQPDVALIVFPAFSPEPIAAFIPKRLIAMTEPGANAIGWATQYL
jgi:hypothetical protein